MKVGIFGAGGIGGYFGARLGHAGADVHLIARGNHLKAIQKRGLRIESVHGDMEIDLPATEDPRKIGKCDYVLFCVKSYDTEEASRLVSPMIGEDTAVISLQNGVENERILAAELGEHHVMGGVAYILSTVAAPGKIEHTGGPARIVFGELDGDNSDRAENFLGLCRRSEGLEGVLSDDIWNDLWEKFGFICAHAGTTAAIRLPFGEIRETDESWDLFCNILDEVIEVAAAEGVQLGERTFDEWKTFARELDSNSYSSLHHDLTHGKRMELEALQGTVVRKADEHNIRVPYNQAVYAILRPWARRNDECG